VDGVAVNEDPIVGGLCIIQAKRYSKIVGVEAVHALAGVMEDKHAAKGVLVTTSWVGKASRDFAARNGSRIQIIEGDPGGRASRQETGSPGRGQQDGAFPGGEAELGGDLADGLRGLPEQDLGGRVRHDGAAQVSSRTVQSYPGYGRSRFGSLLM
jgi:hypothetical protein